MINTSAYNLTAPDAITASTPLTVTSISPKEVERTDLAMEQNAPLTIVTAAETKGNVARKLVKVQYRVPITIGEATELTLITAHVVVAYDKTIATNAEILKAVYALLSFLGSKESESGSTNIARVVYGEL